MERSIDGHPGLHFGGVHIRVYLLNGERGLKIPTWMTRLDAAAVESYLQLLGAVKALDLVLQHQGIYGAQRKPFHDSLGDEKTVEWIPMNWRKAAHR